MSRGLFISFEGIDGCGKSTQMRFLSEHLRELGRDVITTREPGGAPVCEAIREVLLDKTHMGMDSLTEAMLYAAARVEHVKKVIMPAMQQGKIVLCDRFLDSSLAYQAYARGLGVDALLDINKYVYENCMPTVTFYLRLDAQACFDRMNENKVLDRLELEPQSFFAKVYEGFDQLAVLFPGRIEQIDVSGTKFETREIIKSRVDLLLEELDAR